MRGLRITAWAVAIATYVFIGLGALGFADAFTPIPIAYVPLIVVAFLMPATVGLLIAIHQPRNRIAWILLVGGARADAPAPARGSARRGMGAPARPGALAGPLRVADRRRLRLPEREAALPRGGGGLPSARTVSFAGFITVAILDPEPFYGEDARVPNPHGGQRRRGMARGAPMRGCGSRSCSGMLCSLVAGAVAIRIRLKRSVGIERLQTLWLAWTAASSRSRSSSASLRGSSASRWDSRSSTGSCSRCCS